MGYDIYVGAAAVRAADDGPSARTAFLAGLPESGRDALAGLMLSDAPPGVVQDWLTDHDAPDPAAWAAGLEVTVPPVTLPESPAFPGDGMSHHNNRRHPSYAGWSDFAEAVGLCGFFLGRRHGLMRDHPGAALLTTAHLETVRTARERYYRDAKPKNIAPGFGDAYGDAGRNLARLLWLEWWTRWALANCAVPAFYNH